MKINLPEIVGKGYGEWWRSDKRYVVCKGSRGSKKSKTTALWMIYNLIKHPLSNILVVRKVANTHLDSTYSDLKWAARRLGVYDNFSWKVSPLSVVYNPTGQVILFRGLDDSQKLASISVAVGYLTYVWIEEAYEISSEDDFQMIDESIRGELPPDSGLMKQFRITFNPWSERSWLKKRFFDAPDDDTFACTTTYKCNEWLDPQDRKNLEAIKERNYSRYRVAALGEWGISANQVFDDNWREQSFEITPELGPMLCGLDFGYKADPSAFVACFYRKDTDEIYVYDTLGGRGLTNKDIYNVCEAYSKERIWADSAEPKSIDDLHSMGMSRIKGVKKGPGSVLAGIKWLQDRRIIVHPRCVDLIKELDTYHWRTDKSGQQVDEPEDSDNHWIDALRYAVSEQIGGGARIIGVKRRG